VPYTIPADGPVGRMIAATGRHPWRPAHIHMILRAPGYHTIATHVFDAASDYLDSDAVFAVKPSLLRTFVRRDADDPARPASVDAHFHAFEEVLYVLDGRLTLEVAGATEQLAADDYVFVDRAVPHALRNASGETARWFEASAPQPGAAIEDTVFRDGAPVPDV